MRIRHLWRRWGKLRILKFNNGIQDIEVVVAKACTISIGPLDHQEEIWVTNGEISLGGDELFSRGTPPLVIEPGSTVCFTTQKGTVFTWIHSSQLAEDAE